MADLFDEEKIRLRPIERIGALIDTEKFKAELETFERFEVNKSNAQFFRQLVSSNKKSDLIFMNDRLERMYRLLESHPTFLTYFKKPLESGQRRKSAMDELRPYGMMRSDLIDDIGGIIQELGSFVTMLWHYVELDEILSRKLAEVITGGESKPEAEPKKQDIPWGAKIGDKAYLMSIEGKTHAEIAQILGLDTRQVSQYVKRGIERGRRLGVVEDTNEINNENPSLE